MYSVCILYSAYSICHEMYDVYIYVKKSQVNIIVKSGCNSVPLTMVQGRVTSSQRSNSKINLAATNQAGHKK